MIPWHAGSRNLGLLRTTRLFHASQFLGYSTTPDRQQLLSTPPGLWLLTGCFTRVPVRPEPKTRVAAAPPPERRDSWVGRDLLSDPVAYLL